MKVRFVLVCEGPSDAGLVPILQVLCVHNGASEAVGVAPDFRRLPNPPKRDAVSRLATAVALEPTANLVFFHRDADSREETQRVEEISAAANAHTMTVVPVVPIQQTEAWLLLDESAIRSVVENPNGKQPLGLPKPQHVETLARPKSILQKILVTASGLTGRRLHAFRKEFGHHRALLLERLDIRGLIGEVPAWKRLEQRVRDALAQLSA